MDMQPLFSTPEREKILDGLLDNPGPLNAGAMAKALAVSRSQVYNYIGLLEGRGLFKNGKLVDNATTRSLRATKNLMAMRGAGAVSAIRKRLPKAKGIGVYGSWAKGANTPTSDVDIWVKLDRDVDDLSLARLNKELSTKIGAPVEVLAASPARMEHLRKTAESVYHSLFNSVTLWGESL